MNSLNGKKALVTGGGSGIGRAIVKELAALGAQVFIHYHTSKRAAEELLQSIVSEGGVAHTYAADLTKEDEVKALVSEICEKFGGLDILVNNCGDLVSRKDLGDITIEFYRKVMAVNIDSMMLVTREALPLLRNRGGASIVNISSLAGQIGGAAGSLIYSVAKGAALTFTRSISKELAPYGIRVNAVTPGFILGSRFHEVHTTEEAKKRTIAGIPLGRAGTCEDVARAVAFLASEYNGFITGATLNVNGGAYTS